MDSFRKRLIHIHHCRGSSWRVIAKFVEHDYTLKAVYSMNVTSLIQQFFMKKANAEMFYHDLHSVTIDKIVEGYSENKVGVMTRYDVEYPDFLKEIYDPPWVLYYKGNHTYLKSPRLISVIGTRTPSSHALPSMKRLLSPLIESDWTIVSGLALGIDAMAHQITLNYSGKTIAVIGSGFNHIYPKSHAALAQYIGEKHLLLSEYPPYQSAQKWHFPMRNRIISGLSKGTLVIEAKEKSGSLITADQALQQGREVFAVPGPIIEERSIGTNKLIQQGAKLVLQSDDILTELNSDF